CAKGGLLFAMDYW
nr:immunoglobulin heavy chain junction region [Mus musculus]MBK4196224.1 immunoglobulin heavy chain junction region [Mus musculus]